MNPLLIHFCLSAVLLWTTGAALPCPPACGYGWIGNLGGRCCAHAAGSDRCGGWSLDCCRCWDLCARDCQVLGARVCGCDTPLRAWLQHLTGLLLPTGAECVDAGVCDACLANDVATPTATPSFNASLQLVMTHLYHLLDTGDQQFAALIKPVALSSVQQIVPPQRRADVFGIAQLVTTGYLQQQVDLRHACQKWQIGRLVDLHHS